MRTAGWSEGLWQPWALPEEQRELLATRQRALTLLLGQIPTAPTPSVSQASSSLSTGEPATAARADRQLLRQQVNNAALASAAGYPPPYRTPGNGRESFC